MKKWKNGIIALMVLVVVVVLGLIALRYFNGEFDSVESFQVYMTKFGPFGPIFLTLFQALQVVIPFLPSQFGFAAGSFMFGTWGGFLCNYIGISAGSIIAYFLGRKFGIDIVLLMFSQKTYDKWSKKVEQSRSYDWFMFIATLLPLFPDDFLCYFSGLIKMDAKKFIWIIIIGKPWCILAYSIFFGLIK